MEVKNGDLLDKVSELGTQETTEWLFTYAQENVTNACSNKKYFKKKIVDLIAKEQKLKKSLQRKNGRENYDEFLQTVFPIPLQATTSSARQHIDPAPGSFETSVCADLANQLNKTKHQLHETENELATSIENESILKRKLDAKCAVTAEKSRELKRVRIESTRKGKKIEALETSLVENDSESSSDESSDNEIKV